MAESAHPMVRSGAVGQGAVRGRAKVQAPPEASHCGCDACCTHLGPKSSGASRKIDSRLHERILRRLDRLDAATSVKQTDVPGFDFHPLHGKPQRHSVHVNGPWCLTFEFEGGDALRVDLEQYH